MSDAPEPVLLTEPAGGVPEVITTQAGLDAEARRLADGHGPIALDTERASGFRYGQRAFLVQIRRPDVGIQLVDPIGIDDFAALADTLAGPEWILHAASQDLPCLAEMGLRPKALFDTELAARLLGYPKVGLASLTEELLGVELAKTHGAADWSRRPLPPGWLAYAALDVELLHELRTILKEELAEAGRSEWAEQEFEALLTFEPRRHAEPWRRTSGFHKLKEPLQWQIVRSVWEVREEIAERIDRAPGRVLHDRAIMAAANAKPKNLKALSELPEFQRNRRRLTQWWQAINDSYSVPAEDLPGKPEQTGPPNKRNWERRKPEAAKRLTAAREFVVGRAEDLAVTPEILVPPDLVRLLCWEPPPELDEGAVAEMLTDGGARPWQVSEVTSGLVEALIAASAD